MKYFLLITGLIIVLVLIAQFMIARSTDQTEQQRYTVLFSEGEFEIRSYPPAILASVEHSDTTWRGSASTNFRRLAGYIFGGNREEKKIAMTAPVHMESSDSGSRMSFVMPSSMELKDLPVPQDQGVHIAQVGADTVAVLRFSGFAGDNDIRTKKLELMQWLQTKKIPVTSQFRYLGYNPPYQLVNRRNEVAVSVRWEQDPGQ